MVDFGQMGQQGLSRASAAVFRQDKKILEGEARVAEAGGKIVEEKGETDRLTGTFGNDGFGDPAAAEEGVSQGCLGCDDLMGELVVGRELANELQQERNIVFGRGAKVESGGRRWGASKGAGGRAGSYAVGWQIVKQLIGGGAGWRTDRNSIWSEIVLIG